MKKNKGVKCECGGVMLFHSREPLPKKLWLGRVKLYKIAYYCSKCDTKANSIVRVEK
jgi:DNA-directed RNA polymerase subunit RPC12/RpoP